jgi:phosphonate degradation associated HDIG domain protein
MIRLSSAEDIERLYAERGGSSYGEDVTQTEHALQCARLAEADGAAPPLVIAALLHDIGYLFEPDAEGPRPAQDSRHEIVGARALKGLFGERVRRPIALHVAAKRYLCFKDPAYRRGLSAASQESLALQGGPYSALQAAAFERQPSWQEALALRRYDDMGKRDDLTGTSIAPFTPMMARLMIGGGRPAV